MKQPSILFRAGRCAGFVSGMLLSALAAADIPEESAASVVLGSQHSPSSTVLNSVRGVCRDAATGKVFVTDHGNHRVLRYSSAQAYLLGGAAEAVFGQKDLTSGRPGFGTAGLYYPEDAAIDSAGNLWIADGGNNRVLRFANAATRTAGPAGMTADGVLGQPDFVSWQTLPVPAADDMDLPISIAVEGTRLWIVDFYRGRVLRHDNAAAKPNGAAADGVLGQPDFSSTDLETSATVIGSPVSVSAGPGGWLWVADQYGSRVVRFDNAAAKPNGGAADGVLGQENLTSGLALFIDPSADSFFPSEVSADTTGALWIGDTNSNRVLRFDAAASKSDGADADGVLGAPDMITPGAGYGEDAFLPGWIEADSAGNLWVSDYTKFHGNRERLLRFAAAGTLADGAPATSALGTTSLSEEWPLPSASVLSNPRAVAVDPVSGKIFVSDSDNNRVLRFASWSSISSAAAAEAVFGQPDFTSNLADTAANLSYPNALALDAAGRLYVADTLNHRVLRFDNAGTKASSAPADAVLGQPNLTSLSAPAAPSASRMNSPAGLAIDGSGKLWVADTGHNRVLRFDSPQTKPNGAAADGVVGQVNMVSAAADLSAAGLSEPARLHASGTHLWVGDAGNYRIIGFALAGLPSAGGEAEAVLGQTDLDSADRADIYGAGGMTRDAAGRLWIANELEAIRFLNPLANENGDRFLGNTPDEGLRYGNHALQSLLGATDVTLDAGGNLWVADSSNDRVLRFSSVAATVLTITEQGLTGNPKQFYLKFTSTGDTAAGPPKAISYRVDSTTDFSTWTQGTVQTTTGAEVTWTDPATVSGKKFYRIREVP